MNKYNTKILFLIAALFILPFLFSIYYSSLSADDFIFILRYIDDFSKTNNQILSALNLGNKMYMEWQGTHISNYMIYFIAGYYKFGLIGLKIYLLINIILFIYSLYYLIKTIFQSENLNNRLIIFISVLMLGVTLTSPNESIYWLIGSIYYSTPLIFIFFGISFYLKFVKLDQIKYLYLSTIFGVLGSGGSLVVVGFLNSIYLFIFFKKSYCDKKINLRFMIPFIFCFIFSLANAFAPGNFLRRTVITEESPDYTFAIFYTIRWMKNIFLSYLKNLNLFFIFIIFLLFKSEQKESNIKTVLCVIMFILISIFLSIFPFVLGVNSINYMPTRVRFVLDVEIAVLTVYGFYNIVPYIKNKFFKTMKLKESYTIACLALIFVFNMFDFRNNFYNKAVFEILTGNMKRFYQNEIFILKNISDSKDLNVVVKTQKIESSIHCGTKLSSDSEYWINGDIARFYGKNSVRIEYID